MKADDQAEYYAISTYYTIEKRHYPTGVAYSVIKHLYENTSSPRTMQTLETYQAAERLIEALLNRKIH